MSDDIHAIVTAHWKAVIEDAYQCPIFTAQASAQTRPPYAVAEYVTNNVPLSRNRKMAIVDAKIAIYATSERAANAIATACGINAKVPTGFHQTEIGTDTMRATSVIANEGTVKTEDDPPFGGGKCSSRILMIKIRMGAK